MIRSFSPQKVRQLLDFIKRRPDDLEIYEVHTLNEAHRRELFKDPNALILRRKSEWAI